MNPSTSAAARFPRSEKYSPAWIKNCMGGGAHPLWLAEWLAEAMDYRPGQRVLEIGCGKAASSIFLAREFGVEVWAVDLWTPASHNAKRIAAAGLERQVVPLHCDARSLPFAGEYFDAVVFHDSFMYLGTDALYLNYIANFVKPGGRIGTAGAGFVQEIGDEIPEHLRTWWTADLWSLCTADWLRRHWRRTGIVDVLVADTLAEGWRFWLDWHRVVNPQGSDEIAAVEADAGRYLGYTRAVGVRNPDAALSDHCWPDPLKTFPMDFEPPPPMLKNV
jgi:ubiquinone/menaquinone biosynthesis C-methylase UbiE